MKENIELLALEKDFSELTDMERKLVLAEMSQAEFEHFRAVLLRSRDLDAEMQPPKHLKTQLLNHMTTLPEPVLGKRVVSARFQFWSAAATLLLGLAAGWLLKTEKVQEKMVTEIQVRTDTIWQEKTIWRERVVIRERVIYHQATVNQPIAFAPSLPETTEATIEEPEFTPPKVGTSLGDAPELMPFFTQGDRGR
jgi:hypothetical protein